MLQSLTNQQNNFFDIKHDSHNIKTIHATKIEEG